MHVRELKLRGDAVAGGGAHPERPLDQVVRRGRPAVGGNERLAPERRSAQLAGEVEQVRIEVDHPGIAADYPGVRGGPAGGMPVQPYPARRADLAAADHRNRVLLDLRAAAPRVRHHQQHTRAVAGLQHPVHLAERGGQRLLDVDVSAGGGGRQHHLQVAAHLVGGDHRDVRLLGGQHLAVVGVGGGGAGQLGKPPPALRVGVGQGDDLRPLHAHERLVEAVTVVSLTGVADDHNAFAHRSSL